MKTKLEGTQDWTNPLHIALEETEGEGGKLKNNKKKSMKYEIEGSQEEGTNIEDGQRRLVTWIMASLKKKAKVKEQNKY